jgi:CBS domain-containing protein
VQPNATVQMVASIMDWRYISHVLVEDEAGGFCGLVSHRDLLHVLAGCRLAQCPLSTPVREIMEAAPVTASLETPLATAVQRMLSARTDCLPVVSGGRLVGVITSHDALTALARMLEVPAPQSVGEQET